MKKSPLPSASEPAIPPRIELTDATRWSTRVGLVGLVVWLLGGLALEGLLGFKVVSFVDDPLRREMWRLAHAHGTLLSALCLLVTSLPAAQRLARTRLAVVDRLLAAGAVLVPIGFLLGGLVHFEGDPGPGILVVPAGAILFAAGLVVILASPAGRDAR